MCVYVYFGGRFPADSRHLSALMGLGLASYQVLLECGANVVAIRTRKPAAWRKTFSLVKEGQGGGKLMWPQASLSPTRVQQESPSIYTYMPRSCCCTKGSWILMSLQSQST